MESGKRSYLFVVVALLALSTLTFSSLIFSTQASSNLFAAPFGAQESDGDVSSDENEPDELEGLVASGEYEFAEEVIRERLEKNKEDVVTLRALAEVFAAQGKYDESLVELAKYPAAQKSADVLAMVGQIHARVGKLAESERSFRAALTLRE